MLLKSSALNVWLQVVGKRRINLNKSCSLRCMQHGVTDSSGRWHDWTWPLVRSGHLIKTREAADQVSRPDLGLEVWHPAGNPVGEGVVVVLASRDTLGT